MTIAFHTAKLGLKMYGLPKSNSFTKEKAKGLMFKELTRKILILCILMYDII